MHRFIRTLFASLLLPLLAGCHQAAAMHLRVPHGFHGQIVVSCDSSGDAQTIDVDVNMDGRGRASVCPRDASGVYLDRDGSSTLVNDFESLKTGDGLVTQIRLTAK